MEERSMDTTCASDPSHAPDAELVRDARQGGVAAFEALTARHFPMVYALAYARLGAREATEDLAQEVFLLACLHLDALADPARFAAWLGRIARNEAGMWRRRSQSASRLVRLVPLDDLPAEPTAPASQEARTALEADEETRALHEALFRLPEALREVVVLHYFEDLTKAEIAERLEVHPATVGRQIEKALKAMKRTLEPILRRAAPAFRHSGQAAARTTLLVGAVAAMSAPAKAALLAEGGASVAILAAATQTVAVATSWQTISSGGFLMSAKTQFTAVLILLALLAGGAYYQISRTTAAPKQILAAAASARPTGSVAPTSATATFSTDYKTDLPGLLEIMRNNSWMSHPFKAKIKYVWPDVSGVGNTASARVTTSEVISDGHQYKIDSVQYDTDNIENMGDKHHKEQSSKYIKNKKYLLSFDIAPDIGQVGCYRKSESIASRVWFYNLAGMWATSYQFMFMEEPIYDIFSKNMNAVNVYLDSALGKTRIRVGADIDGIVYDLILDPQIEYNLVEGKIVESRREKAQVVTYTFSIDYTEKGGKPLVSKAKSKVIIQQSEDSKVLQDAEIYVTVEDYETIQSAIPDNVFQFTFPEGTQILDFVAGTDEKPVRYVMGKSGAP